MHPLLKRQLRKAFGADPPDSPQLRAFIDAVGDAYAAADDDRHQLEHSIELASEELFERNFKLQQQLAVMTQLEQAVDRKNRDMKLILDNVAQGLVTVGLDGVICSECSSALAGWFGVPGEGTPIWALLFGHDPELEAWARLGFEMLQTDTMPLGVMLGRLPAELTRDGRAFRVEYGPIGEPMTALLVVVSDITEDLARFHRERAQRELVAVFEKAVADRSGLVDFVRGAEAMVAACAAGDLPLAEQRYQIHTLKGNASMFGLETIVEVCAAIERRILDDGVAPDRNAIDGLTAAWRGFHDRIDNLIGLSQRATVVVDHEEYRTVVAMLGDRDTAWAARIRRWGLAPARAQLERFAEQARRLADRLGKPEPDIEIHDADVHLDRDRFAPLWSALIHAVRNAVDHGIEPSEERLAAGKAWQGRLSLRTAATDEQLIVEIEDDGAGIDFDAVTARASSLGIADRGEAAVFAVGVSTASGIGEVSGCGVGLGSLRAACAALGGRIELDSRRGAGTTIRCVVPLGQPYPRAVIAEQCA